MLNKLLKYDSKNLYKVLIVFYTIALFFSITTRILYGLEQTLVIKILANISQSTMIAMLISAYINCILRNWARFKESIYGDESYLTHTLPVKKSTIYQSKFILSITSLFITTLISILCLLIVFYTKERWDFLTHFIDLLAKQSNISSCMLIILTPTIVLLEVYTMIQSGLLGIIIGHKKNNAKLLKSVIYGFLIYIINQTIILTTVYISGFINKDIMKIFTSNNTSLTVLKPLLIILFIAYIIITIIMNIICTKELNKGVNVE